MSEAKWRTTGNGRAMVRHLLRTRPIPWGQFPRRWRLFLVACAYGVWDRLPLPCRVGVEIAEAAADGDATGDVLDFAEYVTEGVILSFQEHIRRRVPAGDTRSALQADPALGLDPALWPDYSTHFESRGLRLRNEAAPYSFVGQPAPTDWYVRRCCGFAHRATWDNAGSFSEEDIRELPYAAALVRDIFGNPYRPVAFDPRWRSADVLGLAQGIYEDRAFNRLPILADALMDAGCDSEDILVHCRSEGPHVRGCWVVDRVLNKE